MKLLILLFGCLVAITTMFACESKSGKLNESAIENIIVKKNEIYQQGKKIEFVKSDTIDFMVTSTLYQAYVSNTKKHSDSTVLVTRVLPLTKPITTALQIN
jgi:hypothetical protein